MSLKSWIVPAAIGLAGLTLTSASAHEIHVKLFGQPCLLEGPASIDLQTLKLIHAISPEQLYPEFEPSVKAAAFSTALEKLRKAKGLPDEFDTYKERLTKRLQAEVAFLSGLAESRKTKKAEPLLSGTRQYVSSEAKQKAMETWAKKLETNLTPAQRNDVVEQLFSTFSDVMPADPEEEFHRAIRRLKVQYTCTFEDGSGSGSGDESSD